MLNWKLKLCVREVYYVWKEITLIHQFPFDVEAFQSKSTSGKFE